MMEDTYSLQGENSVVEAGDLLNYFEESSIVKNKIDSIEDILSESSTEFFKLEYFKETRFFASKSLNLEFPSNWSIFNVIKQALTSDMSFIVEISEFDFHSLYQVLQGFLPSRTRLFLVASKDGVYFCCPRIENMEFEGVVSKFFSLAKDKAENEFDCEPQVAAA